MDEETLFESEATKTRTEVATLFHHLGDGLRDESRVSFREGENAVAISVPSELSVEVEVERESTDDGREVTEVELELEWEGEGEGEETDLGDADQRSDAPPTADLAPPDEPSSSSLGRFEVYRDRADEWRWRLVHRNGNIIATSGEGYTSRQNARKGLRSVMTNAPGADVTTDEE